MSGFFSSDSRKSELNKKIITQCDILMSKVSKGDLGKSLANIVLEYSPRDLQQMKYNFSEKIRNFNSDYRENLEMTITAFLNGTYESIRLMNQKGAFSSMNEPLGYNAPDYWKMVASQCTRGDGGDRLRFLKFLLSGFCMFIQDIAGHPVGMLFPGGDRVELIKGIYYCPVRTKANDVESALCPFCPAIQTPEIGYLKPPVNPSEQRKQEFIKDCYDYHHFNG